MAELVRFVPTLGVRRMVSKTTVGRLRSLEFEVEPMEPPQHCTIWLPDDSDATLASVAAAFDPPEVNPVRRRPGRTRRGQA